MKTINKYYSIWFAWYPVKTQTGEWAWLENVGRTEEYYQEAYDELRWRYIYFKLKN